MVQPDVRTAHPYYMYDAVHQQPEAVAAMLQESQRWCTRGSDTTGR